MSHIRYENIIDIPPDTKVLNIYSRMVGTLRNGDMIALLNFLEFQRTKCPGLKLYLPDQEVSQSTHCIKFLHFLKANTDGFSDTPGIDIHMPTINLWNFRGRVGDLVTIKNPHQSINPHQRKKKITIFPIYDAPYNQWRNWSLELTQEIIDSFDIPHFADYEKVFCSVIFPERLNYRGFAHSSDFDANLVHLIESDIYCGGDTGMSHFAGVLEPGPFCHYYLNGEYSRLHTSPMNFTNHGFLHMYAS